MYFWNMLTINAWRSPQNSTALIVAMPLPMRNVTDYVMFLVEYQCMAKDMCNLLLASLESGKPAKLWILLLGRSLGIICARHV
jgi:hypothetical protein